MKSDEAVKWFEEEYSRNPNLSVAGIAGPGEPLFNQETFETLELLNQHFPNIIKCISTNGIELCSKIELLHQLHIDAVTVTINSVNIDTLKKIYSFVWYENKKYYDDDMAEIIYDSQRLGLMKLGKLDILTKINIIYMEGINSEEIPSLVKKLKQYNMIYVNLIPIIPRAEMTDICTDKENFNKIKELVRKEVRMNSHCNRCAADAVGKVMCS